MTENLIISKQAYLLGYICGFLINIADENETDINIISEHLQQLRDFLFKEINAIHVLTDIKANND